jgi:rare lipoprotein A (peptidoglycan hydrolase)
MLGANWRGTVVTVTANGHSVTARLTDWCACGGGRVIDLDRRLFAQLAPPSRGVLRVTVSRA